MGKKRIWLVIWIVTVGFFAFMNLRSQQTVDIFSPPGHVQLKSSGGTLALTLYPNIIYPNFDSGDPGGIWITFPFESSGEGKRYFAYSTGGGANKDHRFYISWMVLGITSVAILVWLSRKEFWCIRHE